MKWTKKKIMVDVKDNSISFIRLITALKISIIHTVFHLGIPNDFFIFTLLGKFAGVPIFFIISGFLTWNSFTKEHQFNNFIEKKLYRLYPELWGGVIFSSIIMIIIYGSSIEIVPFLAFNFTQATVLQFWTPDCLRGYGCGTPNGSLWTMGITVQCYIVLFLLYNHLHNQKIKFNLFFLLAIIGNFIFPVMNDFIFPNSIPIILYKLSMQTFIPYLWLFILGAFFREYYDKLIKLIADYWFVFLSFLILTFNFTYYRGAYGIPYGIFLAPTILGFAYKYSWLKLKVDLSYGIYIYHMIVVNAMIEMGYTGELKYLFIIMMITVILSYLSHITLGKMKVFNKQ